MAKYRCVVCGYIFDEEKEGRPFEELERCPLCKVKRHKFELVEDDPVDKEKVLEEKKEELENQKAVARDVDRLVTEAEDKDRKESLEIEPAALIRKDPTERYMAEIHEMAVSGQSISAAMGTRISMPKWEDILIMGAPA